MYLAAVKTVPERIPAELKHPFDIACLRNLDVTFRRPVTFFVGENGSGKSTLLEALAVLCGFPMSGGGPNELPDAHGPEQESPLAAALRPTMRKRPPDGYFLRAEFQAHFASLLDRRRADPDFGGDPYARYGGQSLYSRSHGEAFLAVLQHRIRTGLFLFDEPESALSPQRQLTLLELLADRVATGKAQFLIATHAPILLTFPDSEILSFDGPQLRRVTLEETSHYRITKQVLDRC